MKMLMLAESVSGTAVAAQTAVGLTATPFLDGRDVIARLISNGLTVTPTILIQGSPDNSTWTTLATHTVLVDKEYNIKASRYMRTNVTVAAGAGTFSCYLNNGV